MINNLETLNKDLYEQIGIDNLSKSQVSEIILEAHKNNQDLE